MSSPKANPAMRALLVSMTKDAFTTWFSNTYPDNDFRAFAILPLEFQSGVIRKFFNEYHNLDWLSTMTAIGICYYNPFRNPETVEALIKKTGTTFIYQLDTVYTYKDLNCVNIDEQAIIKLCAHLTF